jgi:nitronate monooxygenase
MHVGRTMEAKRGDGLIFVNCMEKLTMNAPRETLRVRMAAALDAGIDGITLAAGLHLGSFALIEDHPRFRDAKLGIIVSSLRALQLFLRKTARSKRLPDYVVVEGPLAGGHLGFGMDWAQVRSGDDLRRDSSLSAGRAARYSADSGGRDLYRQRRRVVSRKGAAAVQVATRFTVSKECGLPEDVKQRYFEASEDQIEVNQISPTGYPMRMLSNSPAIGDGIRPNCEAYGYLLDSRQLLVHQRVQPRGGGEPRRQAISVRTRPVCARRCATSTAGPVVTMRTGSRTPPGSCRTAATSC